MYFKHIKSCLLSLLLTVVPALAIAQARVTARLDSTYVVLGMPTVIHLEASVPEGQSIEFPHLDPRGIVAWDDTTAFLLEWADRPTIDTLATQNGMTTLRQDLEVFPFDSASLFIPAFPFVYAGDTLRTNDLALKVIQPFDSLEIDPEKFFDIKDVLTPDIVIWDYIGWVLWPLLVIALAVAAWYGWRYYRRYKRHQPVVVKPKKVVPPNVVALQALDALQEKHLWQNGKSKQFHTELTDILRIYIEGRFSVPAMEKTTDEILDELYELHESQHSSMNSLHQILTLADLVKFAKYEPMADENQLSFMNARMFVTQTAPSESTDYEKSTEAEDAGAETESDSEPQVKP
mgnify:FL=1